MQRIKSGELLAQEAQYARDRLIDDFRAANLEYCAYVLSDNPSEEEIRRGEFNEMLGDSLRTAIGITVEYPKSNQVRSRAIAQRLASLIHIGHARIA